MLIVQNERNPAAVRNAIIDALEENITRIAVCSAYISTGGTNIFTDCCRQYCSENGFNAVRKAVITSFDFGITDPAALRIWQNLPNTEVRVAGAAMVRAGSLTPARAFHPKMYLFFFRRLATVVIGSANLTSRGLTTNAEAIWLQRDLHRNTAQAAWQSALHDTVALDEPLLQLYEDLRRRSPPSPEVVEVERVPQPMLPPIRALPVFPEAIAQGRLRPEEYEQMWVQAERLQGGSGNQLELPRGAHRFFRYQFARYDSDRVEHIGMPVLVSGVWRWDDRPLTWHGDNDMERINLPTRRQGGFDYRDSVILFRRLRENVFELAVAESDSDLARAWRQASHDAQRIYRLGVRTTRVAGFI